MELEAQAILASAARLLDTMPRAVALLEQRTGQVVTSGVGKSGHLARLLASTLRSTGVPAVFLHPTEAFHGDLGLCAPGDVAIVISKSGTTIELLQLVPALRASGVKLIGIVGNIDSPLGRQLDVALDASVAREADAAGFLPSASLAVAMAVGHALTIALMESRGFAADNFGRLHVGGQLGRSLRVRVGDAMHSDVPLVTPEASLKDVVIAMSRKPLGAACVVNGGRLLGLVTDGDLRRALEAHDDLPALHAQQVMTINPITIGPDCLLQEALVIMEDRPSQISVLPVVDHLGRCLGLLRLHDLYRPATPED
jgi:arabinose-5-phosphate isomerase